MARLQLLEYLVLYLNTERLTQLSIEHIESMRNLIKVYITKSTITENLNNSIFKIL